MRLLTRPARLTALLSASAFALASSVILAQPAAAAGLTSGQTGSQTGFNTSGGSTCSITSGAGSTQAKPVTSNGATVSTSTAASAVATDSGNPSDTTQMTSSAKTTARSTMKGGSISSLTLTSSLTGTLKPALGTGSACDSSTTAVGLVVGAFSLTATKVLDLTVKAIASGDAANVVQSVVQSASGAAVIELSQGTDSRSHRILTLPPGDYQIVVVGGITLDSPAVDKSGTGSVNLTAVFADPGTALAKQTGTGSKYLKLGKKVDCTKKRLVSKFTPAAGPKPQPGKTGVIAKATFTVNGGKPKTFSKPYKGFKATLKKIDPTDSAVVEVLLTLSNGVKQEVRRTYLPCA